ncbi:hypothetical protein FisN_29Lh123 [Fistulifera solaris]|uniref:DUF1995 domain-containing protein n=1 Tax=Fistulifera solaris TaxID=1519565 RepID=A0A1Z5JM19_FISSO|nr:hypothetical protein FisN_29Lh123 [Fistulifera solaris]|eukprot:GAX14902.1 hypothetical protein FisN_29Lh123 [Fistulifera solaris]
MRVVLLLWLSCYSWAWNNPILTRRAWATFTASSSSGSLFLPLAASAATTPPVLLLDELKECKIKLEPIPEMLEQMEWDKVRSILKVPPVNKLWNLGDSQNTVVQLAKQAGSIELLELKDDLALTLQLCDQYTYNNAFVYFQPGNGKYNIKEPQQLARKAMQQIQEIVDLVETDGS